MTAQQTQRTVDAVRTDQAELRRAVEDAARNIVRLRAELDQVIAERSYLGPQDLCAREDAGQDPRLDPWARRILEDLVQDGGTPHNWRTSWENAPPTVHQYYRRIAWSVLAQLRGE